MRIAVTGGAGFIGSNLVFTLVGSGHEVLVVDDLSSGDPSNIHPSTDFRTMDIIDPALAGLMAQFRPEAVVHLAAQSDVSASIADPERDRLVNLEGTRAVAKAAAAAGATKVVSASSAAVYGEPARVPLSETDPKSPVNPYGHSKLDAETAIADELRATDVDFASMRFSNVYGPRQDWRGEGGVVAIFSSAAASGSQLTVYGDGRQTRDFIFVGDVVGAILACLASSEVLALEGDDGPAYNISSGIETSVEDVARGIVTLSGSMSPVIHEPAREGDVDRSALDPSKACDVFGWSAGTELERGLGLTVEWFRQAAG